jgi:hypothetical protein
MSGLLLAVCPGEGLEWPLRGNQNPYLDEEQTTQWPKEEEQTTQWPKEKEQTTQWPKEEEQTTQWPKEKGQKDKQRSTKQYTYA